MAKKDDMSIMLGMLVELGLLEVTKNGAYITTKKGQEALAEYGYGSWDAWIKAEGFTQKIHPETEKFTQKAEK